MNQDQAQSGITLLGLGPGDPRQLTREAWELIQTISEVVVRTRSQVIEQVFPAGVEVVAYDSLFAGEDPAETSAKIIDHIIQLGKRPQGVVYAIPGDPLEADSIGIQIARRVEDHYLPIRIVPGISLAETALLLSKREKGAILTIVDGLELSRKHVPPFPPTVPALITQVAAATVIQNLKRVLQTVYPPNHPVQWVDPIKRSIDFLPLAELETFDIENPFTMILIPPLGESTSFENFQEIIARLRAPDGCPWDREQTHHTLRRHLLEETYEALEALDRSDPAAMSEEFGDLLLQIVLHAQIATEAGEFRMADVIQGISEKLIRRHPHVFGDVEVEGVKGVLQNWEKLKAAEREAALDRPDKKGLLDGVPPVFPSLAQAQELQDRASRVGFDWPNEEGVLEKIAEEMEEVRSAQDGEARGREIGDVLFAIVNLARWNHQDAESILRETNARFRRRFGYIENTASERGLSLKDLSVEEMNRLWDEAKGQEPES